MSIMSAEHGNENEQQQAPENSEGQQPTSDQSQGGGLLDEVKAEAEQQKKEEEEPSSLVAEAAEVAEEPAEPSVESASTEEASPEPVAAAVEESAPEAEAAPAEETAPAEDAAPAGDEQPDGGDAPAEVEEASAEDAAPADEQGADDEDSVVEHVEPEPQPVTARPDDGMRWYVVHTYSGYENKAKQALEDRIRAHGMEDQFGDVLVPSEKVTEVRGGNKRTTTRKFFPGYMFVRMDLNEETWHLVKNTPRVTGFVGGGKNPPPVPDDEVNRITNQIAEGTLKPTPTVAFEKGETVRVVEGPFMNFNGIVEEVLPEKKRVKVIVSILGRSTPVEFNFDEIEKT